MVKGDFKRWMYRGNRPHAPARMLNAVWAALGSTGFVSDLAVTLETTGRKSGRIFSLPVVPAKVAGERYLVSMLGNDANWVRNVRAAGGRATLRSGRREDIRLEEVPFDQRAPILKAYLKQTPGARPHIPIDKDASLAEFERISADFPVFRVVPYVPGRSSR
jgi:hypothetical protein